MDKKFSYTVDKDPQIIYTVGKQILDENKSIYTKILELNNQVLNLAKEHNWTVTDYFQVIDQIYNKDDPEFRTVTYTFNEKRYMKAKKFVENWDAKDRAKLEKKIKALSEKQQTTRVREKLERLKRLFGYMESDYKEYTAIFAKEQERKNKSFNELKEEEKAIDDLNRKIEKLSDQIKLLVVEKLEEILKEDPHALDEVKYTDTKIENNVKITVNEVLNTLKSRLKEKAQEEENKKFNKKKNLTEEETKEETKKSNKGKENN